MSKNAIETLARLARKMTVEDALATCGWSGLESKEYTDPQVDCIFAASGRDLIAELRRDKPGRATYWSNDGRFRLDSQFGDEFFVRGPPPV